ncbi:MAG: nuclear transport factor 2 family protein [Pseudomonadales bacterium]
MRVEHANIVVADLAASRDFLSVALPHWCVRGEGLSLDGANREVTIQQEQMKGGESTGNAGKKHWLHIGDNTSYLTLNQLQQPSLRSSGRSAELAHIGIEVDDLDGVIERLGAAGYPLATLSAPHPYRKSGYFFDANDVQYEFIEYLSEQPEQRNLYGGETGELQHPQRVEAESAAQLLARLYAWVDARDSAALADILHPEVRFRIANHGWIEGRQAVLEANAHFFASIAHMQHSLMHIHSHQGCLVCCGEVDYRRLDGSALNAVPFSTVLRLQAGLIVHYQVYVDISAL